MRKTAKLAMGVGAISFAVLPAAASAQTACAVRVDLRWQLSDAVVIRMTGEPLPKRYVTTYNYAQKRSGQTYWKETAQNKYPDICLDAEHANYFIVWHGMAPDGVMVDVYRKDDSGCVAEPGVFSVLKHARNQERSAKQAFKEALRFLRAHGKEPVPSALGCVPPEIIESPAELRRQLELRKERQLQSSSTASSDAGSSEAVLDISSVPASGDIELDGSFVGSTPSSVSLSAGEHTIRVTKKDYKPWERKMKVTGGKISIAAELEAEAKPAQQPQR